MSSARIKLYVTVVALAASGALAALAAGDLVRQPVTLALLVALAAAAGLYPVRIPSLRLHMTATHPIVLCALAAVGPLPAVLVALAGVVASAAAARHSRFLRFAFNLFAVPLAVMASAQTFGALGGVVGDPLPGPLGPLAVATLVYFLVNTGLVAGAVALEKRRSFATTWTEGFGWSGASYFTGLSVAACMLVLLNLAGPWGLLLTIPPCWLLVAFHRMYRRTLNEKQHRIEDVERSIANWRVVWSIYAMRSRTSNDSRACCRSACTARTSETIRTAGTGSMPISPNTRTYSSPTPCAIHAATTTTRRSTARAATRDPRVRGTLGNSGELRSSRWSPRS